MKRGRCGRQWRFIGETEEGEGRERALGKLTGELTFLDLGCGKAREESGAAAAAANEVRVRVRGGSGNPNESVGFFFVYNRAARFVERPSAASRAHRKSRQRARFCLKRTAGGRQSSGATDRPIGPEQRADNLTTHAMPAHRRVMAQAEAHVEPAMQRCEPLTSAFRVRSSRFPGSGQ
jgi:hypothetical protein